MPLSRLTSVLPEEIQSLLEDENLDFEVALPIENLIQAREETGSPAEQGPSFESLKKFFAGITRKEDDLHQVSRAEAITTVALTFATLIENVSVETVERYFEKVPGTTIVEIPSQLIAQQTEGPVFFLTGSQLTSLLPQELRGEVHVGDHVRLEVPLTEVVNDLPRQILAQLLDAQLRRRQDEEVAEQNEVERESELPDVPPRPQDLEDRRRTTPRF
jgi:uncharacterized protein (DUF2267 family)